MRLLLQGLAPNEPASLHRAAHNRLTHRPLCCLASPITYSLTALQDNRIPDHSQLPNSSPSELSSRRQRRCPALLHLIHSDNLVLFSPPSSSPFRHNSPFPNSFYLNPVLASLGPPSHPGLIITVSPILPVLQFLLLLAVVIPNRRPHNVVSLLKPTFFFG